MMTGHECNIYIIENYNLMDLRTYSKKLWGEKNLTLLPLKIILMYFGEAMTSFVLTYKLNSSLCPFKHLCPKDGKSLF